MEKNRPFNRDAIKYSAAFAMLLNHAANSFLEPGTVLFYVFLYAGYFTAITMCYFLVEGYTYTRSKRRYAVRLLIFAVISQGPYYLLFEIPQLNMLFTLFFCFLILCVQEKVENIAERRFLTALLVLVTVFCDWAVFAAVFTLFFSKCRKGEDWDKELLTKYYAISAVAFALFNFNPEWPLPQGIALAALSSAGIVLSGVVIQCLYNGRRAEHGRAFSKWFFYVFYPAHLMILWLLRMYLFRG